MIRIEQILEHFPPYLRENTAHRKYLVKEYIQLLVLDYLSSTPYIQKLAFIGGTNLRLVKGIDRFSEDLDFDCKNLNIEEFIEMTDGILLFLKRFGLKVEARDKPSTKLSAFRRNIHFPELLFEMGLSVYKEERFLIKIESEDQHFFYKTVMANIKGCGLFVSFPVPPDSILCSMKIAALINRSKGRDFYDAMFLLAITEPDYGFLERKCNIKDKSELKTVLNELVLKTNLNHKVKDFEHLIFERRNSEKILLFKQFVDGL